MARADVAHQLSKREAVGDGVGLGHTQVAVFVEVGPQVPLHVLPLGVQLVLDPSTLLEPRPALGVTLDVVMARADVAHQLSKREAVGDGVGLGHTQVAVFVEVGLQVQLRVLPLCLRARLDRLPHRLRVALASGRQVEGLLDRGVRLAVTHHTAVLGDQRDLSLIRPRHRLLAREALGVDDADCKGIDAEDLDGPVQTDVFWVARRLVSMLLRSRVEGVLRREACTHDLSKVRDVEEWMIGLDAVKAPFVEYSIYDGVDRDAHPLSGRRGTTLTIVVVLTALALLVAGAAGAKASAEFEGVLDGETCRHTRVCQYCASERRGDQAERETKQRETKQRERERDQTKR